jgi:hypothetical protein
MIVNQYVHDSKGDDEILRKFYNWLLQKQGKSLLFYFPSYYIQYNFN